MSDGKAERGVANERLYTEGTSDDLNSDLTLSAAVSLKDSK